jgi:hypothetical protein
MNHRLHHFFVFAVIAAGLLPATGAQAQYYYGSGNGRQPPPLYPYEVQKNQPYAVQVSPNAYVVNRPVQARDYPYVERPRNRHIARSERRAHKSDRPHKRNDPALLAELRQRHSSKGKVAKIEVSKGAVINTRRIVRHPPVIIETKRVVDDPPRIVERRHYVDDAAPAPAPGRRKQALLSKEREPGKPSSRDDNKKRVIEADAEITVIGPDRMSIRLFRKSRRGSDGKASAD